MKKLSIILVGFFLLLISTTVGAAVIDFTDGDAYGTGGTYLGTTSSASDGFNASYYQENGFQFSYIGSTDFIGDYYGAAPLNDVIHGHWARPGSGGLTAIEITKIGGGAFDFNYFILTSNTNAGPGDATGNELTYIEAWSGGSSSYSQLLPSEAWGRLGYDNLGATYQNDPQIYLGSEFDAVDMVRFVIGANATFEGAYCFGMDEFYIDEEAPPEVPEPATGLLLGTALIGLAGLRRRFKK